MAFEKEESIGYAVYPAWSASHDRLRLEYVVHVLLFFTYLDPRQDGAGIWSPLWERFILEA